MAQVVGQLMIEMAANVARLQTDMAKATKTVDGAMATIVKSVDVAKKALAGLVSVEIIGRMAQATKAAIDMADGLGELSEKTGVSVEQLSGLRVAFQLNALQADQVGAVMKRLSVSIAKGADAFSAMGIQVKNADGTLKSTDRILLEVADKFATYRDGAEKAALAVNIFGKSGADLIPVLNQGSAGLQSFIDKAAEFGILIDQDTATAAGKFNDQLDMLGMASQGLWVQFSAQLLPIMTSLLETFRQAEGETNAMKTAMDGLANSLKIVYSLFVGLATAATTAKNIGGGLVDIVGARITGGREARAEEAAKVRAKIAEDLRLSGEQLERIWQDTTEAVETATAESVKSADNMVKVVAPSIKQVTEETKAQGKAATTAKKATKDYYDTHVKAFEAYRKSSKAAEDLIDNIKQETAALKMSSEARAVANELRELEKTGLDTTSAAYKKYAAEVIKATTGREAVRKQIDEQEAARQRWTDLWADVGQSLTDSLMEGGKNAREYLEGTFRSMILRPTIEAAVNATIQSATGSALGTAIGSSAIMASMSAAMAPAAIAAATLIAMKEIGGRISGGRDIGGGALGEFADFLSLGTLSRAFGKGPYRLRSERLQGELGMGGADLEIVRRLRREGGVFSGDSRRTTRTAVEGQLLEFINKSIADMTSAAKTFAGAIGVSGDALTDFVYNVDISLKGLKPEEKEQRIMELMQEFNDAIARQLIPNIDSLSRDGETAAQTLERLSTNFQTVNHAMDLLNQTMFDSSVIGAQFATVLVDAFGGIEEFTQATSVFYDKFFTQAEKTVNVTDMLAREFGKLGLAVPATREEYRRLVEAQNRFTAEGAATYAQLIKLSGAFASVTAEIDAAATALSQTMAEMVTDATRAAIDGLQDQIRATRDLAAESRDMARAYMDAATAIRATAQGLMFGRTGAPQSVLRQQYQSTLQMALGGDLTALQGVGGAASALVESVRGTATSRVDFIRQAALVQSQLEEAAKVADATAQAEITLAQLYDVNVDMMELTLRGIEEGTITNELLQENIAAINLVNASIKEQGGAEGNIVVTTLLTQILAATKKQSEAEAAAVAEAAKQEALRQAEILRQQALAAEAIRKQQEAEAAAAAAIEQKRQDDISAVNRQAIEIQNRLNRTGGGFSAIIERAQLRSQLDALREQVKALGGTPAFAGGGIHSGGLRLVGENGPELEATGPARIYNARQTAGMLAGGADMVAELRLLRQEVGELRYEARATATNTNKTQRLLERVTLDGEAMQTVAYS